jgi:hypothetical protein
MLARCARFALKFSGCARPLTLYGCRFDGLRRFGGVAREASRLPVLPLLGSLQGATVVRFEVPCAKSPDRGS